MILPEGAIIEILSADYIIVYRLRLQFSDGKEQAVNFEPVLRHSLYPIIAAYNVSLFLPLRFS